MCAQRYQSRIVSISNGLMWGNGSGTRYHLEQMLYRFLARSASTIDGGLCLDKVAVFGAPLQWLITQSPQGTAKEYQWGLRSVPEMTISSMKPTVSEIDSPDSGIVIESVLYRTRQRHKKQLLVVLHWEHYPDTGFVFGSSWKRECQYLIDKIKSSSVS